VIQLPGQSRARGRGPRLAKAGGSVSALLHSFARFALARTAVARNVLSSYSSTTSALSADTPGPSAHLLARLCPFKAVFGCCFCCGSSRSTIEPVSNRLKRRVDVAQPQTVSAKTTVAAVVRRAATDVPSSSLGRRVSRRHEARRQSWGTVLVERRVQRRRRRGDRRPARRSGTLGPPQRKPATTWLRFWPHSSMIAFVV